MAGALVRARTTTRAAEADLLRRVRSRRLIFSVSSGRCGSKTLARLFSLLPDVESAHEPRPDFAWAMPLVQARPGLARDFLIGAKLPAIARSDAPIYIETSHLFGKGFYEPALDLGLEPDLLLPGRDPRKIALSYLRLNDVPGRSGRADRFLIDPTCPNFAPVRGWERFTDYQVLYWYALETEARQAVYAQVARSRGARVAELDIDDLNTPAALEKLLADLDLPRSPEVLARLGRELSVRHNTRDTARPNQPMPTPEEMDAQEREVRAAIAQGSFGLAA